MTVTVQNSNVNVAQIGFNAASTAQTSSTVANTPSQSIVIIPDRSGNDSVTISTAGVFSASGSDSTNASVGLSAAMVQSLISEIRSELNSRSGNEVNTAVVAAAPAPAQAGSSTPAVL